MKHLLISSLLFSFSSYAGYGKPELLARYSGMDSYNAPNGIVCFSSEPQPTKDGVYLGCQSDTGTGMVRWSPKFEVLAHTETALYSQPKEVDGKVSWYEFNEGGVLKLYESKSGSTRAFALNNLGPSFALVDAFVPVKNGAYVYRLQDETVKTLSVWKERKLATLELGEVAYLFPPVSSPEGALLTKIRRSTISESAPDELLIWDGQYKTILKDRDADPTSKIKSFRHQFALEQGVAAVFVTDDRGEALVLLKDGKMTEVARAGRELASFDFFAPKMKAGVLVFRGVDFQKRKVVYIYENGRVRPLITQGDVVSTDKGLAKIQYPDQDAIFYGAPGISPNGDVYQQATLTDAETSLTLYGIGLIKYKKE